MDTATLTGIAFAGVAVFGAVLAAISAAAWRRTHAMRMAGVFAGFAIVAIQGAFVATFLVVGGLTDANLLLISAVFEAALLVVWFVATLGR